MIKSDALTEHTKQVIEKWKTRFPEGRESSAVIAALHSAQHDSGGYLTTEIMDAVADALNMPRIQVYEVATFYSMYELKPVGRHKICVCTNVSCMVNRSDEIVEHLEKRLDIKLGETTVDGKFTLKEVECLGACAAAPMCEMDEIYHENLTPEKLDQLIDDILAAQGGQ